MLVLFFCRIVVLNTAAERCFLEDLVLAEAHTNIRSSSLMQTWS